MKNKFKNHMYSIKTNNSGMTLVEVLAAGVIITILIVIAAQGIITASNWFGLGEETKKQGEIAADSMEGKENNQVEISQTQTGISLINNSESINLGDVIVDTHSILGGETAFSELSISTGIIDYKKDILYFDTVTAAENLDSQIKNLINEINKNDSVINARYGINNSSIYKNGGNYNDGMQGVLHKYLEEINFDKNTLKIQSEFAQKYLPGTNRGIDESSLLFINVFFFSYNDYVIYIGFNEVGGGTWWGTTMRMIYDYDSKAWFRGPKQIRPNHQEMFVDFKISGDYSYDRDVYQTLIKSSLGVTEGYNDGYLHYCPENGVGNFADFAVFESQDISNKDYFQFCDVVDSANAGGRIWKLNIGRAKREKVGGKIITRYVRDVSNGWTLVVPFKE